VVELLVGLRGVDQVAGRKLLHLAGAEVIDDEAVEDCPQVVPEAPLARVGAGKLVSQELGPELLFHLVREVLVAELEPEVALDGVVVARDELLHRVGDLSSDGGSGGHRCVGRPDQGPLGRDLGQSLLIGHARPHQLTGLMPGPGVSGGGLAPRAFHVERSLRTVRALCAKTRGRIPTT